MLRFADLITQVHSLMIDETVAELMQRNGLSVVGWNRGGWNGRGWNGGG